MPSQGFFGARFRMVFFFVIGTTVAALHHHLPQQQANRDGKREHSTGTSRRERQRERPWLPGELPILYCDRSGVHPTILVAPANA